MNKYEVIDTSYFNFTTYGSNNSIYHISTHVLKKLDSISLSATFDRENTCASLGVRLNVDSKDEEERSIAKDLIALCTSSKKTYRRKDRFIRLAFKVFKNEIIPYLPRIERELASIEDIYWWEDIRFYKNFKSAQFSSIIGDSDRFERNHDCTLSIEFYSLTNKKTNRIYAYISDSSDKKTFIRTKVVYENKSALTEEQYADIMSLEPKSTIYEHLKHYFVLVENNLEEK